MGSVGAKAARRPAGSKSNQHKKTFVARTCLSRVGRAPPPTHRGVTVINVVPQASGVPEVCCQVARIESFGVLAYHFGVRTCNLATRKIPKNHSA